MLSNSGNTRTVSCRFKRSGPDPKSSSIG